MANHTKIVPFFIKWEGGKSSDTKDSASSYTCGVDGIHTNKGVTYKAWVGVFGNENVDRFLEMSDKDWGLIFKSKYWDAVKGDEIKFQSIADCLVSWAWGSGARTAIKEIQRELGLVVDGIIGKNTIGAINSSNEDDLFRRCIERRERFFRLISQRKPSNMRFLRGWLNRLADFKRKFKPNV